MKNTKRNRWMSLMLMLAVTVCLAFGVSFPSAAADSEIVILHTNDVHCSVDENIGYGGLALYEKQMLNKTPYVALVDAGDAVQGGTLGTLSEGADVISVMNQAGYDFAVPGNHEFDYGMPRFLELADSLDCGYYACNFMDLRTGQTVLAPYKIMTFGDTRVAFVGAATPESFTKSTPVYFQDEAGNYLYGFCEDETGDALYRQIQSAVDAARAEGAEYVILVAHLGGNYVTERWSSQQVLAATEGIDACIDGHSHEAYVKYVKNKNGQDVLVSQTGTKLESFGKMVIAPDGTITAELIAEVPAEQTETLYTVQRGDSLSRIAKRELGDYSAWREIYDANRDRISNPNRLYPGMTLSLPGGMVMGKNGRPSDREMDRFLRGIQSQFEESLKTVLGHSQVHLTVMDPATGMRAVRNGETNMGDLTADAYRFVLGADIGFSNGGGIRADIVPGDITYNDTLSVFPFGNMGCVIRATGQQILDALEMSVRDYPQESGSFMQVSGLTYTIDASVSSSVETDDKGNFLRVSGPRRVSEVMVGEAPLKPEESYTLASHNYMLKSAGSGMTMFQGCELLRDEVISDVDLLSAYIQDNLGGSIGEEYADPAGQGRITIK